MDEGIYWKQITLTQGYSTLVDAEQYAEISKVRWIIRKTKHLRYAMNVTRIGKNKQKVTLLHRVIMNAPEGVYVDHINGNGLDNRKSNLRLCTQAENVKNARKITPSVSGYKGVYWKKSSRKWVAQINANNKKLHLGLFVSERDAAIGYNAAALEHHREFANLNVLEDC
jgi:hypothetical protein